MFNYLIVLLDDCSTSYCHYDIAYHEKHLMPLEILQKTIFFAMKENLMVQYVLPNYKLPQSHLELMDTIDNNMIVSSLCKDDEILSRADVVILNDWACVERISFEPNKSYVLKTAMEDLFEKYDVLKKPFSIASRFNIVITNIESFDESDYEHYRQVLSNLGDILVREYQKKHYIQCNLLTDRITIDRMNNCGAGETNITVAPNGKFYICPAFFHDDRNQCVGDIEKGINIPYTQLYRIDHAPICRHCDAFQCKRCIWLNKKLTFEVNTPSKQQCVISHIERNASQTILSKLRDVVELFKNKEDMQPIDYLDPFDVRDSWDKDIIEEELNKYHRENYL